eukprot:jgi/Orpsp1_1/1187135/evm.model.d7180000055661.1
MVDTINYQLTNKELNVEFDDNNYDIDCNGRNHYYILNSISFNGKNNTIFNYQYSKKGSFYIHFNAGLVDKKVIFQNIKFLNYDSFHDDNSNLFTIETEDETDRYTIEFNNCIFDNIKGIISNIKITCLKSVQSTPQIIFKNCKFIKSDEVFQTYHFDSYYNKINIPDCFSMYFINCYFEKIKTFGELYNGEISINNLSLNKPFFTLLGTYLELDNVIFKNCHSYYNHLILITGEYCKSADIQNIKITNSEFN